MENSVCILECALELFHSRGYDAVGVQEIVNMAGVTKPTLYHYFGSKKGLLQNLLESKFGILEERLRDATVYEGDLPLTLNKIAWENLNFASTNKEFYLFMLGLFSSGRQSEGYQAALPLIRRYYGMIEAVFENAAADLGNMNDRQHQFAIGFTGILNHYFMAMCTDVEEFKINKETAASIVQQFMYGIYS